MTEKTDATNSTCEHQQFADHLEQASKIVQSWPAWKQTVLGGHEASSSDRAPAGSSEVGSELADDATCRSR